MAPAVAGDDGDYPRMARNGRTSEHALVPGRGNDDNATPGGLFERLVDSGLGAQRGLGQANTEIDDASAGLNHVLESGRQIARWPRSAGHHSPGAPAVSEKIGRTSSAQPGQMPGTKLSRFAWRMPAT